MTTATFTETLQAEVAALQAKHPVLAGALDKAYGLVVDGAVFPLEDGRTAHVRSQSDPTVSHLVNGTCDCKATQYHAAPCAHRLAFRVYQRTVERLAVDPEARWEPVPSQPETPPAPAALPEARCSVNVRLVVHGREMQITLRGDAEAEVLARLEAVLERYPASTKPPAQPQGKEWCSTHGVALKVNHGKDGRTWLSHKTADGWCKGM